jgi:hypothetical protein
LYIPPVPAAVLEMQQFITKVINEVGCDISLANVGRVRLLLGHGRKCMLTTCR